MCKKFVHGGDIVSFAEKFGRRPLDFSSNINPIGLSENVRKAYINAFDDCSVYPDHECRSLRGKIAAFEGISVDKIICGNGAADLIFRVVYTLKPRRAILPVPSFAEYEKALRAASADVRYFYLNAEQGFAMTDAILDVINGNDILFLCNPNNPTGCIIEYDLLHKILLKCKEVGCFVVIDECFLGFTHETSSVSLVDEFRNIIVIKAFTKLFAMPGLRLGYMVTSNDELLNKSQMYSQAWSVSAPAAACGIAALEDDKYIERSINYITKERAYLNGVLEKCGAKIYGSCANYLFFYHRSESLAVDLAHNWILIRDCANYEGLGKGYYRVAVRKHEDNIVLTEALQNIFF